jgi:GNAT superfamily N-acetyltransferase
MELAFRSSTEADKDAVWELHRLGYEQVVSAQFGHWDVEEQRARFAAKWADAGYSVASLEGVLVGAFSTSVTSEALFLGELLVLPTHQNRGIGTRVVERLQAEARRLALPLALRVLHLNRARGLYERLGFRTVGRTETHFLMRWEG